MYLCLCSVPSSVQIHPPWPFLLFFIAVKKSDLYTGVLTLKMKKSGPEAADRPLRSPIMLCSAQLLPWKQEKTPFAVVTKDVFFMEQGTGVEPFLVQIHPPLTFSDYFAQLIWSKRCAGFLVRKRKKPASVWLWLPFRSRFSLILQYFGPFLP